MPDAQETTQPVEEIFDELFTLLEDLEVRSEAIAELLKTQGIATEEKLQPYLEQAGNAASVRWRAARARMEHLFTPIPVAVREANKEKESLEQEAVSERDEQADQRPRRKVEVQNESEGSNTVEKEATSESKSVQVKPETANSGPPHAEASEGEAGARRESKADESTGKQASQKWTESSVGPGAAKAAATDRKSRAEQKSGGA